MQVVMVMFRSDGERRSFSLTREVTVIGRREDCDLRIPLTEVSRKHCRLVKDGQGLKLEDLGSSNGTYVNGQRVREAALNPGDTLTIGPVVFALQIDGEPADDQLHPMAGAASTTAATPDMPTVVSEAEPVLEELEPVGDELQATTEGIPDIILEDSQVGHQDALVDIDVQDSR